jgi:ABC-type bacteriocin/lantibiotic exporter with double-glycine peptidase domain
MAKLIARFYELQQGRLLIDDQDIRTFDLAQYRHQLGIVSQVPYATLYNTYFRHQSLSYVEKVKELVGED